MPCSASILIRAEFRFAAGNDHAAFTGDNILGDVKTETAEVPEGSGFAPLIFGLNGVGTIFYYPRSYDSAIVHRASMSQERPAK